MAPKKTADTTPRVATATHVALWDLVKDNFIGPIRQFVTVGIRPLKGDENKNAEVKVWTEVAKSAYASGVDAGYVMAHDVFVAQPAAEAAAMTESRRIDDALKAWLVFYDSETSEQFEGDPERATVDPEDEQDWTSMAIGFLVAKGVNVTAPVFADNGLAAFAGEMSIGDIEGARRWYDGAIALVGAEEPS